MTTIPENVPPPAPLPPGPMPPRAPTRPQVPANKPTGPNPADVDFILNKIRRHLAALDFAANPHVQPDDLTLVYATEKISFVSLVDILNKPTKIDFIKLIRLSDPNKMESVTDSQLCDKLYNIIFSLGYYTLGKDFVAKSVEQKNIYLSNFREFIKRTLDVYFEFMKRYTIINMKMTSYSFDLLYLLNITTHLHVNTGNDLKTLDDLYKKLVDAIKENTIIYRNYLKPKPLEPVVHSMGRDEKTLDEIRKLSAELEKRIAEMKQLNTNIREKGELLQQNNVEKQLSQKALDFGKRKNQSNPRPA